MPVVLLLTGLLPVLPVDPPESTARDGDPFLAESRPSDTEALLRRRGQPDLKVSVADTNRDDYLLLYEGDDADPALDVHYVYYVEEDVGMTHRIKTVEPAPKRPSKTDDESWYRDILRDVRHQIDDLKERKKTLDRGIHGMPGLNYFDRVDLLSKDMEVGWGKGRDETRTTLAFEPDRDTLTLTFEIPLP